MLAKTAKHWLGFVAILALDIGATAPAEAASPTPISACPYTITAPGNYVVTRNLTATGTCIKFAAPVDNVALDLQGHGITGNGTGYGIVCLQNPSGGRCNRVVIANGAVTRFSGVSDSRSNSNGSHAITASGEVSNSTANNNGGYGISGVIVTDSTAKGNALGGIIVSSGNPSNYASVVDSNASGNSGDGIQSSGNVISSTANNNGAKGIVLFCPVSAYGNAAINNPGGNLGISDNTCVLLDNKTP